MSFRLDRFATLYLVRPISAIVLGRKERCLPILMYHSISDTPEDGVAAYYRTITRPDIFRAHLDVMARNGWRGVTLKDGLGWLASADADQPSSAKPVAITFDDGFEDFYTNAYPALREHGFGATMYLPTAFIADEPKYFKGRRCLSWTQVRSMNKDGIEFGSHTVNHPKLVELEWHDIVIELLASKKAIEHNLGVRVDSFAYPYAFPSERRKFRDRLGHEIQAAGYSNCVTTRIGIVASSADMYSLKRLPANGSDDTDLLCAKLSGKYSWLAYFQAGIRMLKFCLTATS